MSEQVSLIVGHDFVVSFQEKPGDVFGPIRARIKNVQGRIRKAGSDYLAYALPDSIVDNYFVVLEHIGDTIEGLEKEVTLVQDEAPLRAVNRLKRDLIHMRKTLWPLREVIIAKEMMCHRRGPPARPRSSLLLHSGKTETPQLCCIGKEASER